MQDAKKEFISKLTCWYDKMAIHDADSVDVSSIHALEEVKKEVNNDFLAVQHVINNLLLSHSQELGQVKVEYYKTEKLKNRANL